MGARSSTKKKARLLTEEQRAQFEADLANSSDEDRTNFEEDDDPLALAGDFVEEDGSEESK